MMIQVGRRQPRTCSRPRAVVDREEVPVSLAPLSVAQPVRRLGRNSDDYQHCPLKPPHRLSLSLLIGNHPMTLQMRL